MQIVRLILAGIAVLFGLIFTIIVALVGLLIFTINRLLGRTGSKPVFGARFQRPTPAPGASTSTRISPDGAIDIEATEVKN